MPSVAAGVIIPLPRGHLGLVEFHSYSVVVHFWSTVVTKAGLVRLRTFLQSNHPTAP